MTDGCSTTTPRIASRLGTPLALWCGILALALSLAFFAALAAPSGNEIVGNTMTVLRDVAPMFLVVGFLELTRGYGRITRRTARAASAVSVVSLGLGALAGAAWRVAFEALDNGDPVPAFGHLDGPLALAAWALGAVAAALVVAGLIGGRMRPAARTVVAVAAGVPAGAAAVSPAFFFGGLAIPAAAVALIVLSYRSHSHDATKSPAVRPEPIS